MEIRIISLLISLQWAKLAKRAPPIIPNSFLKEKYINTTYKSLSVYSNMNFCPNRKLKPSKHITSINTPRFWDISTKTIKRKDTVNSSPMTKFMQAISITTCRTEKALCNKKITCTMDSFFKVSLMEKDNKRTINFSLSESMQMVKRLKEN